MKFDPDRALSLASSIADQPRAEILARSFQSSGLHVERISITGDPQARALRQLLSWQLLALTLLAPLLLPPLQPLTRRLPFLLLGLIGFITFPRFRSTRSLTTTVSLNAYRPLSQPPPLRIIFASSLDPPLPLLRTPTQLRVVKVVRLLLAALLATHVLLGTSQSYLPSFVIPLLGLTFEVALLARDLGRFPAPKPGPLDNRDGLAFLAELARTWPRRHDERWETRFLAFGGPNLEPSGLSALNDLLMSESPTKPTCLITLWSPGLGPPFAIAAKGLEAYEILDEAAENLRIPYDDTPFAMSTEVWPHGTSNPDVVAIVGARQSERAPTINPASLALAAQLATEVALRWVRQTEAANLARSSQNPG